MNKQIGAIAKINLKTIKIPYFITGLVFLITFLQTAIVTIITAASGKSIYQLTVSCGNYFWLLVLLAAIFIPTINLRKIVNLGGKRKGFFWGSMISYVVLAGLASLANTIYYYTYEQFLFNTGHYMGFEEFIQNTALWEYKNVNVNLIELFGWSSHGIFFAFIQQFAFLLLLAAVIHTLAAMQDQWVGWVTDVIIAAILAVFIPIASLRALLLWFFNLIIFNENAFVQITACLFLAVIIYAMNKFIFARKAI